MRADVIECAAQRGIRLIVSVDTGIRANDVVRHANAMGIDVILTDHHLPQTELPPALAILNPNRPDCSIRIRTCAAPESRSSSSKRYYIAVDYLRQGK